MKSQIENASGDPVSLERLYRSTIESGEEAAFRQGIEQCAAKQPENILLSAWMCRFNQTPDADIQETPAETEHLTRHWKVAVGTSVVLGLLYALFAGDKPPAPIPGEARSLFWISWAPLTALGTLFFVAMVERTPERLPRYGIPALGIIPVALYVALLMWNRSDNLAELFALHLPFLAWAAVGIALTLGRPNPARQGYAFFIKSIEAILTGGIFFGAGMLFIGLTYGIFAVLGIKLPEEGLQTIASWGVGAIPILAIASVYNPALQASDQNWSTGLARILRILTRLMLPLALAVLAVYVLWFIPQYFWKPFQEREVLIVYNATILAILVLMTVTATGPDDHRSPREDTILRQAVLVLGGLTWLLNVYALAAIISRTIEFGLSPNRYVVLGWNVVTLVILAAVSIQLWRAKPDKWVYAFRESIARVAVLSLVWAFFVLIGLPIAFG
jgi:hypothetical protein